MPPTSPPPEPRDPGRAGTPPNDPGLYGRSFADVYDRWYPPDATSREAVAHLAGLAGSAPVLELGIGTGRLAVPLMLAGVRVAGVDASPEMVDRLRERCEVEGLDPPTVQLADVADGDRWPRGPFAMVVGAFNLVCNVVDPDRQAALFHHAAVALEEGGRLVLECAVPDPAAPDGPSLATARVDTGAVVLVATSRDAATGVVTGQHVELRDGEPPRLRPWQVRVPTPAELDRWAQEAGLRLEERRPGWDRPPVDASVADDEEPNWVRTYRAPGGGPRHVGTLDPCHD